MEEKMYGYFYFRGKSDESQHVRLTHREVIDLHSFYYHLGILSDKFKNCPTRIKFVDELYQNFSKYNQLPTSVLVILDDTIPEQQNNVCFIKNKYSHKLMRQIFSSLGYQITDISTKTFIQKESFFRKKKVSKWSTYIAHR